MKTTARRFIGKVLPDGHLSLSELVYISSLVITPWSLCGGNL